MDTRIRHIIGQGIAAIALALFALALAGIVTTDTYSRAAGAEARGVDALMREVAGTSTATAGNAMLADMPQAVQR